MTYQLDWAAPVEPGSSMIGLRLGMTFADVQNLFGLDSASTRREVSLPNAPRLIADASEEGAIFLRAADMKNVVYDWQNVLARLCFEHGKLWIIIVDFPDCNEGHQYQGKIFGRVGLGSKVSEILEFAPFEYDDAEEWFYSDRLTGLELSGTGACDLATNPSQIVTSMRVFLPRQPQR